MRKIIIMSTDVYTDLSVVEKRNFDRLVSVAIENGNKIIFTSRDVRKKESLTEISIDNKNIYFKTRNEVKSLIKKLEGKENYFIVVGNRDQDLFMAASNKLFFIVPKWCRNYDEKVEKYGVKVKSIKSLSKLIDIITNQQSWYYRLDLDDKTTILSLTNANTQYGTHSDEELELVEGFRSYLKEGDKKYSKVLFLHFLASISNNIEFREIKDWGIMPSSGTKLNEDMLAFKEKARELMNGRKREPIFIRHSPTWKSHESYKNGKNRFPCDRHFETIKINPVYNKKLKGRVVCIFDDYLTNGTTFETARNLLLKAGVKKMFFVSIGRFGKKYYKQNYNIDGDVFTSSYTYTNIDSKIVYGQFNSDAISEIETLYDIIYSN